jgi:hypothetical protein
MKAGIPSFIIPAKAGIPTVVISRRPGTSTLVIPAKAGLRRPQAEANIGGANGPKGERSESSRDFALGCLWSNA